MSKQKWADSTECVFGEAPLNANSGKADGKVFVCILCGGSGQRLWPVSTPQKPKPFHPLWGGRPLIEQTIERLSCFSTENMLLIGHAIHTAHLGKFARMFGIGSDSVILEPQPRNTGASVALACLMALKREPQAVLVIAPSDHAVDDTASHRRDLAKAVGLAQNGNLVLLGAEAKSASSSFGYILPETERFGCMAVKSFVEKPVPDLAADLVGQGAFWNSGLFVFQASAMIECFQKHQPELLRAVSKGVQTRQVQEHGVLIGPAFSSALSIPFDTAIVESHEKRLMLPMTSDWSDIGTWNALHALGTDTQRNAVSGPCSHANSTGSLLHSTGPQIVAQGVNDMAVIATPDAVYVSSMERAGERLSPLVLKSPDQSLPSDAPKTPNERVESWLRDEALPLWLGRGFDEKFGGFVQALSLAGEPVSTIKTLAVQAQQVSALSKVSHMDQRAEAVARGGFKVLQNWQTRYQQFPAQRSRQMEIVDVETTSQNMALVLSACSDHYQLDRDASLELAQVAIDCLEKLKALNTIGFWHSVSPEEEIANAESHLHIVEAAQSWYGITGDERAKTLAEQGWAAFFHYFYDERNWRVSGFPDAANKAGPWSPSQHFRWVCCWDRGDRDLPPIEDFSIGQQFWASAIAFGQTEIRGLSSLLVDGTGPGSNETRLAVQCHHLQAAIALNRPMEEIDAIVFALFKYHIEPARSGLWHDRLETKNGRYIGSNVSASGFKALVSAFDDYLQWCGTPAKIGQRPSLSQA